MRLLLSFAMAFGLLAQAKAEMQVPSGRAPAISDAAVSVSASQTSNLQPGQNVTLTVTVTNNGPESIKSLAIDSSQLFPEQVDINGGTTDCGVVVTGITDAAYTFWYSVTWYVTDSSYTSVNDLPLAVGESRSCHFTLAIAQTAPQAFPLDFHLPSDWHDPNPANDRSRVLLQLVPIVEAVPSLSQPASLLLALGLLSIVAFAARTSALAGYATRRVA